MPLISRTFDQLIDFTRTSAATYVNSAGLVTLTPPSVNLLTFTQEFDNAAWVKGAVTVFPNQNPAATTGPELRGTGAIAMLGTSTAATYNTTTGVGTATRTDPSNLSGVTFTIPNASGFYAVNISNTGATTMQIRINALNGTVVATLAPGTGGIFPVSGMAAGTPLITLTASTDGTTASFTVTSVRQLVEGFIAAPDGTFTADAVIEDTINGVHRVNATYTFATTAPHTFSAYVKANGRNFCRLSNGSDNIGVFVNLTTGAIVSVTPGAFATVSDAGNGWWRIAVTFTPLTAAAKSIAINVSADGVNLTYTGNGVSGLFVWGAQLEVTPDSSLILGPELNVSTPPFTVFRDAGTNTPSPTLAAVVASLAYRVQLVLSANTSTVTSTFRVAGIPSTGGVSPGQIGTNNYYTVGGSGGALTLNGDAAGTNFTVTSVSVREITGTAGMPSAYAKNVGGLFPARFDYDPITLAPRGILIEEQRTNVFTYSEQFDNAGAWNKVNGTVSANATTSPDGTANADAFVEDGTTSLHYVQQSIAFTSGVTYTLSVYIKPSTRAWLQLFFPSSAFSGGIASYFNLAGAGALGATVGSVAGRSITAVGNGWYRVTLSAAATATTSGNVAIIPSAIDGSASYTGVNGATALFLYGAQLEAGAFATSYIPTVASTVTRTADIANVTAANFSSWYNQPTGTFVTAFDILSTAGAAKAPITTNDGSSNNINILFISSGGAMFGEVRSATATQALLPVGTPAANAVVTGALAYRANDFAATINGAAVATDTAGATALNQNVLNVGYSSNFAALYLNGHVRSIRYYPARLNNAQLQTLTA